MMNDYRRLRNEFDENWRQFERYCGEQYKDAELRQRILHFAREHARELWPQPDVQDVARSLAEMECVGDSERARGQGLLPQGDLCPLDPWVKSATAYLRRHFNLDFEQICQDICRERKRELCQAVGLPPQWEDGEFEAVMRIIYQIRCNLVHGGKPQGLGDEQLARDRRLLELGNIVLLRVLEQLRAYSAIPNLHRSTSM